MKVIVVIPAYNEGPRIVSVVRGIREAGFSDVIVVDDGSNDDTAALAREACASVVGHCCNRGAGAATKTGWEAARRLGADAVVDIDADGQHDPSEMIRVLEPVTSGEADLAIGARIKYRGRMPVVTRFFNFAGNLVTYALSGVWLTDSQSGFRALSRKAIDEIELESSGFDFCTEMIIEARRLGLRIAQVPITTIYRPEHLSKGQNYSTGLETVFKLVVRSFMR